MVDIVQEHVQRGYALDHASFGRVTAQTIRSAEAFRRGAAAFAKRAGDRVHALVPFPPDSNLVCLALNPVGNRDIRAMNAFVRGLHDALRCEPSRAVQAREFYASMTTLRLDALGEAGMARMLAGLGLEASTLVAGDEDADRLVILRHTLMNPFLRDDEKF